MLLVCHPFWGGPECHVSQQLRRAPGPALKALSRMLTGTSSISAALTRLVYSQILHATPPLFLALADNTMIFPGWQLEIGGGPIPPSGPATMAGPVVPSPLQLLNPQPQRLPPLVPSLPQPVFSSSSPNSRLILGLPFPTLKASFRTVSQLPCLALGKGTF